MNAEKYLGKQFLPNQIVLKSMNSIIERHRGEPCAGTWSMIDLFNLGMMMGTRKERMRRNHALNEMLTSCSGDSEIFKISNDELSALGIDKGDFVICHCGIVPVTPLSDLVVYKNRNSGMRVAAYYGCYAKSHWTIWPSQRGRRTDFIGNDCIGVVSHVFSSTGELKYFNDTSDYPEEFNNDRTIQKEPSNIASVFNGNLTYIYDVL